MTPEENDPYTPEYLAEVNEEDYKEACAELHKALETLNAEGSATGIAVRLADDGAKGQRFRPCECPVARWLQARIGVHSASVGSSFTLAEFATNRPAMAMTPDNVSQFILAFDGGYYPYLEEAA